MIILSIFSPLAHYGVLISLSPNLKKRVHRQSNESSACVQNQRRRETGDSEEALVLGLEETMVILF